MDPALTRIEREYVLRNMADEKPALLLVSGTNCVAVVPEDYAIETETLTLRVGLPFPSMTEIRVFFSHRKRGIFFDSAIHTPGAGFSCSIPIGDRVYKESAAECDTSFPVLTVKTGPLAITARPASWFPVESFFPNASLFAERKNRIETLSERLGFADFPLHAARVFEYATDLIAKKKDDRVTYGAGILIFADERAVCLTVRKDALSSMENGGETRITIEYPNRKIKFVGTLTGEIAVDSATAILAARVTDMHEEDKRFIHERVYRNRYE